MPLSPSDRAFLRQLYANLADEALEPDSRFYEPVYQRLGLEDPVQEISTRIDFDGVESIRLFSGFRGSGKTTELHRLQRVLEERGYFVLYADALNYVNAAEPIEITNLLMVMAGAFSVRWKTSSAAILPARRSGTGYGRFSILRSISRKSPPRLVTRHPPKSCLVALKRVSI